ncbi:MAG TPA: hypothetical protein VGH28_00970 [Polyangiaceae bacterium]|jgi:hypothetical protein
MTRLSGVWLLACACVASPPPPPPPPPPLAHAGTRPSDCREDIPDCVAACALRETSRTVYLEWFDRRCATVVLGRNPDRADADAGPEDLLDTR